MEKIPKASNANSQTPKTTPQKSRLTHIRSVRVVEVIPQDLDDPVDSHAKPHEEHDRPYEPEELRASFPGVADAQDGRVGAEFGGRVPDGGAQPPPRASAAASFAVGVELEGLREGEEIVELV